MTVVCSTTLAASGLFWSAASLVSTLSGVFTQSGVEGAFTLTPPAPGAATSLPAGVSALYTDPADEWVQDVFEVCAPFLDGRPTPRTITFSTDGAWLKPGYGGPPAVILGPGEPKLAHQTDEWCSMARIEQSVDAFATIMRRWCGV